MFTTSKLTLAVDNSLVFIIQPNFVVKPMPAAKRCWWRRDAYISLRMPNEPRPPLELSFRIILVKVTYIQEKIRPVL